MKTILILSCVLVAANALSKDFIENMMNKMQEVGIKCVAETHASDDDVANLIAHKIPDTHEGKCMIFCFHKAFNIQTEDGTPNTSGALQSIEPMKADDPELHAKVSKIFEICGSKAVVDPDPCLTAAGLAQCGTEEGKAMGLSAEMFEI